MQSDQFQLHSDIELQHWWFVARREIIGRLIRRLLPPGGLERQTIIDVGCGTGANAAALADDYRCIAIDTSAEAVSLAADRFEKVDFRVGFAPDDLEDCFGNADLIMLNDVLEHVPDDFELLSKLLSAARPGALFLITVPADMALWSVHDESFGHYRRYDSVRLARTWQHLPVERLLLSHFNTRLYPIVRCIRTWNRIRGRSSGRVGTDFKMPGQLANRSLKKIFAGEALRLERLLDGATRKPYKRGVSLLAVLRRGEGDVAVRSKPDEVADDFYDPQRQATDALTAIGSGTGY